MIQVEDWGIWFEQNFSNLELVFKKALNSSKDIPEEFIKFDRTRIHYVVIARRRNDYNSFTYRSRRDNFKRKNILVIHYDNLIQ
jgi:hypothetical protein